MTKTPARHNQDLYVSRKAAETAAQLVKAHNMDYATAYFISLRLWHEARRAMMKIASSFGEKRWRSLSFKEKAAVSTAVVRSLLDRKRLMGFISGEKTSLV
ncbi:MAG: hypothetical protein WA162_04200 [Thermodesulfobacteriota bacterium]